MCDRSLFLRGGHMAVFIHGGRRDLAAGVAGDIVQPHAGREVRQQGICHAAEHTRRYSSSPQAEFTHEGRRKRGDYVIRQTREKAAKQQSGKGGQAHNKPAHGKAHNNNSANRHQANNSVRGSLYASGSPLASKGRNDRWQKEDQRKKKH